MKVAKKTYQWSTEYAPLYLEGLSKTANTESSSVKYYCWFNLEEGFIPKITFHSDIRHMVIKSRKIWIKDMQVACVKLSL